MSIEKTGNMKAEQRLQIREGMSVADVKKYGSKGQQLAASLFDAAGKDGVYTKQEAERFNNYNFSVKDNAFTMYDKKGNQIKEIKYDNIEDLYALLNNDESQTNHLKFKKDEQIFASLYETTEGGKITWDLSKGTITADGVKGKEIMAISNKVTVKNSDVENINLSAKELEIKNTKDKGVIFDSSTEVEVDKDTNVKVDTESDVTLERRDK